ncbi:tudor domain-containing protein 1-like [Achroia grisella]|uniref:tudor domain-containing protein 1-like n=1 Tax=Achroia grisella TaxID=688607 RepID=UPI0027D23571|nr:tudor domain-containing protein 1-like [Achroia grisella]
MDTLSKMMADISLTNFDKHRIHWVEVVHITDPHNFFVRPTTYKKYLAELTAHETTPIDQSEAILGELVIYKSKESKTLVRGKIMKVEPDSTFEIKSLDTGCVDKSVPLNDMYKPMLNSDAVEPLAIHCQLADCFPNGGAWGEEAIDAMKHYVANERAQIKIKGRKQNTFLVELANSCPDDIGTLLIKTDYASFKKSTSRTRQESSTASQVDLCYKYKTVKVGDKLQVQVLGGKSLEAFYACQKDDYETYMEERNKLTFTSKAKKVKVNPKEITVGLPVAVLTDDQRYYERGIIKSLTEMPQEYVVQYVDCGKEATVQLHRLKPMQPYYFKTPVAVIFCASDDKQAWNTGLNKFIYNGYEFSITVVKVGDNHSKPNLVHISHVSSGKTK